MPGKARTAIVIGMGNAGKVHAEVYEEAGFLFTDLDSPEYADVFSIATPDHLHGQTIIAAAKFRQLLDYGQAVFCEKPICTTMEELEKIKSLPKFRLGTNFPLRYNRKFIRLKDEIKRGVFGHIYFISGIYHYGRRHKIESGWRSESGYSMMMGGGIHIVDLIMWLTGERMVEAAQVAVGRTIEHGRFQLENGAIGNVVADFGSDRGDHWHEIRIHGTEACLTIRNYSPSDKKAALRDFIAGKEMDFPGPLESTEACLKMAGRG